MSKTYVEIKSSRNIEALNVIFFKFAKMPRNIRSQTIDFSPFNSVDTPQTLE